MINFLIHTFISLYYFISIFFEFTSYNQRLNFKFIVKSTVKENNILNPLYCNVLKIKIP